MAEKVIGEVILRNVRLSFPHLFEPQEQTDKETGKTRISYKANFLIPKSDPEGNLKRIKIASQEAKQKKWGDEKNWPKLRPDKLCLRDGDLESWDGFEGNWYLSCNSPANRQPSLVINRKGADGLWLPASPGQLYAGCFVNAIARIWAQDDKEYGKRINASVESVQFYKKGDAFGAAPVDPNDKFTDDMAGEEGSFGDDPDDGGDDDLI